MEIKARQVGIYWIASRTTGKVYIGSTFNINQRWHEHRRDLRNGCHHNFRLQEAYDRGEVFDWIVVEDFTGQSLDRECLLLIEQSYINMYHPALNILHNVFSRLSELNTKRWIVCDPNGFETEIENLEAYCRDQNLIAPNMAKVARGDMKHHRGYRCRRPEDATYLFKPKPRGPCTVAKLNVRRWSIKHPSGFQEEVLGLTSFCKLHGLDPSGASRAAARGTPYLGYHFVRLGAPRHYSTRPKNIHKPSDALPIL